MKNIFTKKILSVMLALCIILSGVNLGSIHGSAAEASAEGLKNYVASAVDGVNTALKQQDIPITTVVDNTENLVKFYVTDKETEAYKIIDNISVLKDLFNYDGITNVFVDGIDLSQINNSGSVLDKYNAAKPILSKFGITLDNMETYKIYDMAKAKAVLAVEVVLSNGESVTYNVTFVDYVSELEEYLSSAVTKVNKNLSGEVPMTIVADNNTHKLTVNVTNVAYKLFNLASVEADFLADIFGYKEISAVTINGDKCASLTQETLLAVLINAYFPGTFPGGTISLDFSNPKILALLSKTFNDLIDKPLTVMITLKTGESVTYTMTFVDAEPKCPTCGSKDHTTHPQTPTPSTPTESTTVTYNGVARSLKVSKKTTSAITIKWTKPTSSYKTPAGYRVQYAVNGGKKTTKYTTKTNDTVKNLKAGTVYSFTITPFIEDTKGNKVFGKSISVTGITKPNKVTVSSTSGKKKAVKVSWKKVTATGYQLVVAKNKKFTSGVKKVTISQAKKNSITKTVSKLSKKKTYYVRVRAYTKSGNTVSYGAWSSTKTVKTK